jgi:hypothetical protein
MCEAESAGQVVGIKSGLFPVQLVARSERDVDFCDGALFGLVSG